MAGIGKWVMGGLVGLLGLLALFLAANAKDGAMYLFGMAVAVFAVLFIFGLIRGAFESADGRQPESSKQGRGR
jgi:hypothetical protein